MSFAASMRVSTRINVGFGLVLSLLIAVFWIGYSSLLHVHQSMDTYETISSNAVRVSQIGTTLSELRRNVLRYSEEQDAKSLDRIREARETMDRLLPQALEVTKNPERHAVLVKLQTVYNEYLTHYEKLPSILDKKKQLLGTMAGLGQAVQGALADIEKSALNSGDMSMAVMASAALRSIAAARMNALYFILQNNQEKRAAMTSELETLVGLIEKMEREADGARLTRVREALTAARQYKTSGEEMGVFTETMNDLIITKLGGIGVSFRSLSNESVRLQDAAMSQIKADTFGDIEDAQRKAILLSMMAFALGATAAFMIGRGISLPVNSMTNVMHRLADGDHSVRVPSLDRGDEIGTMAKAVEVFRANAIENLRLQKEQEEQKRRTEEERKAAMREMANAFEAQVGGVIETVTSAAVELQAASKQMAATAEETSAKATAVAGAAEESSSNVAAVSSASEQMTSSIREIATQVDRTKKVAGDAENEARQTTRLIEELSQHVTGIGEIVSLINDIASQTNLLALNATIEAARAGDAGKGFAVVASEVKNLASQTAKATEDVATRISSIQGGTERAVRAIATISNVIGEMSAISGSVAAAVEQQGAATNEISRNVAQAAAGTTEVSANISAVETASQETGAAASQISHSASELSVQANVLKQEVRKFLDMVRSDKDQMVLARWEESLSIDNGGILDTHHKRIINEINELYASMLGGEGKGSAVHMIDTLGRTLQDHFREEEDMMARYRYPQQAEHSEAHRKGWAGYQRLRGEAERGDPNASRDAMAFAGEWLRDHIGKHDRLLADFMHKNKKR